VTPDDADAGAVVIKLGGTTIAEQAHVLDGVVAVSRQRPTVVVHGGGKRITEWSDRLGIATRFEGGLRVTDESSLEVVTAVLRGTINTELVAAFAARGCAAVGISGVDAGTLRGPRVPGRGLVVTVDEMRPALLDALLAGGFLPVVAPLSTDTDGVVCNVNGDDAAAALARGLRGTLILLTDVQGVRGRDGGTVPRLSIAEAEALIADGTIAGGMIPKVTCALYAVTGGATGAIIADGSAPDAVARAISDPTFGTRFQAGVATLASDRSDGPT